MAEDGVAENGAAEAEKPAEAAVAAPSLPVPEPLVLADQPAAVATPGKADVVSLAASAAGHLLVGLLIVGFLPSMQKIPEVIAVKLIPADQAPPKPEQPDKKAMPAEQQRQPAEAKPAPAEQQRQPAEAKAAAAEQQKQPPAEAKAATAEQQKQPPAEAKAAAAEAAKGPSGGEKESPPPGKGEAAGQTGGASWRDIAASLGMAEFGRKTTLPDALLADLSAQAKRCWTVPTGWSDAREVSVTLRFQLGPDGTLDGEPAVVEFPATPIGAAAAKAAIEAVKQCGPYHLPADQYEQWKDIQLPMAP